MLWPRMMAPVPVGMSRVATKMRIEMAEIIPGTTAGRQASAKMRVRSQMPSADISMAIQTPTTVDTSVTATAIRMEYQSADRNCWSCTTCMYQPSVTSPRGKAMKFASLKLSAVIRSNGPRRYSTNSQYTAERAKRGPSVRRPIS